MTIKFQIYKCNICGNLVQILQEGEGNLICCGKEMELMNTQYNSDEIGEKHTPIIEIKRDKRFVNVNAHPMTNGHYIQFIEAFTKNKKELQIKFFSPEENPEMEIFLDGDIDAVEFCNIHHLWGNKELNKN